MQRQVLILPALLLFTCISLHKARAQLEATPVLDLHSVTFEEKTHVLRDGDASTYDDPQWTDSREYPVIYERNTTVEVFVEFEITPDNAYGAFDVKGETSEVFDFPAIQGGATGSGIYGFAFTADNPLTNAVAILRDLSIDWSYDAGEGWKDAGTSVNTIYVVFDAPMTINSFETGTVFSNLI
jgi:hypothetical protein